MNAIYDRFPRTQRDQFSRFLRGTPVVDGREESYPVLVPARSAGTA
jgi:hypothetical protein